MTDELQQIKEIKSMMEKSSRFISLSGWSGVAAGTVALIGAAMAYPYVDMSSQETLRGIYRRQGYDALTDYLFHPLSYIAIGTFLVAMISAFIFTYVKSQKQKINIWGKMSRKVAFHFLVPFVSGTLFIIYLIGQNDFIYIAPLSLIIYGISLFSVYKFTIHETLYLALTIIALGLINLLFSGYSFIFWTAGFGVSHIVYGVYMWYKYDRTVS
jgi:uncharacterized membrane protein